MVMYTKAHKNGKMYGNGNFLLATGNAYGGNWRDYKKHGNGKNTAANGDVYKEDWCNVLA